MTTGLPQQLSSIVSKKFIFSIGLTEDSFSKRAKRKYLINSILDRSDRRTFELNILDHQDTTQKNPPNLVAAPVCATLPETIRDTHVQPQVPSTTYLIFDLVHFHVAYVHTNLSNFQYFSFSCCLCRRQHHCLIQMKLLIRIVPHGKSIEQITFNMYFHIKTLIADKISSHQNVLDH
jgi:hypothetical protein